MSHELRDPLDDLLSHVPTYVVAEPRAAWAAGARRRTRRRVGAVATVLVLVALLGAVVGTLPRALTLQPASGDHGAGGYPTRIDYSYRARDLPDTPGPIAGVLERPLGWYAVSPRGHLWTLPGSDNDYPPALSPDGTELGYLNVTAGRGYEIHHLTTGGSTGIDVGAAHAEGMEPWRLTAHSPSFWSPDSQRLLVPARPSKGNVAKHVDALVVAMTGGATRVRAPRDGIRVVPVGWLSNRRLAWLAWQPGSGTPVAGADLLVTDVRGRLLRTVRLALDGYVDDFDGSVASVSPNGHVLSIGGSYGRLGDDVLWFSTRDGVLRATIQGVPDAARACPSSWGKDTLQVPTSQSYRDAALASVNGDSTILADPRLGVDCSIWAVDALDGTAHGGIGGLVFGDSTSWLSWHWREVAAGTIAGLALVVVGLLVVRRRRRVSA